MTAPHNLLSLVRAFEFAARIFNLADKIANLRSILDHPPVGWTRARRSAYFRNAHAIAQHCRGIAPPLHQLFDRIYRRGARSLGIVPKR